VLEALNLCLQQHTKLGQRGDLKHLVSGCCRQAAVGRSVGRGDVRLLRQSAFTGTGSRPAGLTGGLSHSPM
jgi:hypothetical protein